MATPPQLEKYRFSKNDSFVSMGVPAKNVYSIHGKKLAGTSGDDKYILPENIEELKKRPYEERERRFGNTICDLSYGDSVIFLSDDPEKKRFAEYLIPLPERTAKCPISQWEVEETDPADSLNKAFDSPRAGGKYEIEPDVQNILPDIISIDFNSDLINFTHKHQEVGFTHTGLGDRVLEIIFNPKLTEEQKQEFYETVYNKYLLKIRLFAWIAKQNLITRKLALVTTEVLNTMRENISMPNYEAREDLLLAFLAKTCGRNMSSSTYIPSIDEIVSKDIYIDIDFSKPDISALLYCNSYSSGIRSILLNLRAQGFIKCLQIKIDASNVRGFMALSQDPLEEIHQRSTPGSIAFGQNGLKTRISLLSNDAPKKFPVKVTIKGVQRANLIIDNKKVFIAMGFGRSTDDLYEQGIKKAIEDTGFVARRVDKIPHINLITVEILKEIEQARFVVADFSQIERDGIIQQAPGGVYYEVGYAQALKKPVIWTCHESGKKYIHFDIEQYNFIFWDNKVDLYKKLKDFIPKVIIDI